MKYLSVCSGIEAATVAWHNMGWEPVAFSEIEKFPSQVLAHHYPNVPNWGDMTNYQEWPNANVNILVGGTPCQSFSVAGLRKGMADPRGNLALTHLAIADKYRPEWIVWENVPGVLSSNGGRDFGSFLGALAQLGYGFAYRVLDAQYFGVAQRRRRVFVVGHLGDWRPAAAVLFESPSLRRDSAPSREARKVAPAGPAAGAGSGSAHAFKVRGGCEGGGKGYLGSDEVAFTLSTLQDQTIAAKWPAEVAPTLNAAFGSKQGLEDQHALGGAGLFVPAQTPTIGGDYKDATYLVAQTYSTPAIGHIVQDDVASTITKNTGAGGETQNPAFVAQIVPMHDPNPTLDASYYKGTGERAGVERNVLATYNVSPTINTVSQRFNHGHDTTAYVLNGVQAAMQVRRLTPTECERLQGFPDGYTDIKDNTPDGPRYKSLGNSMAVPVMQWIGQRIAQVDSIKLGIGQC